MPASEQNWYNPKIMHVVFGVSSVVMLIATVCMMAEDHMREWKTWQVKARHLEKRTLEDRISGEQTADYALALAQAETDLAAARSGSISQADFDGFVGEFAPTAVVDGDQADGGPPDVVALADAFEKLGPLANTAREKRDAAVAAKARLRAALAAVEATGTGDPRALIAARGAVERAATDVEDAEKELGPADAVAAAVRTGLLSDMTEIVQNARLNEDNLSRDTKFRKADLTAAVSLRDLAVGGGLDEAAVAKHQATVDVIKQNVVDLTARLNVAMDHRLALEAIVKSISADEESAQKKLIDLQTDLARLHATLKQRSPNPIEWLIRQPILDAFYNGDMGIEQVWLPELTINYNFKEVGRFDRCVTCHRAINQTAPGSAAEPAYRPESRTTVTLPAIGAPPVSIAAIHLNSELGSGELLAALPDVYGISLANEGRIDSGDVTIEYVLPETAGAQAGLQMGDVIEAIGDARIYSREQVADYFLGPNTAWGEPLVLSIRRGVPQPFTSHPRLDLLVGPLSPHKQAEIGCTVCHDGQGSATAFKWASHTPNDYEQAKDWSDTHGWFENSHWIFPMLPQRFVESNCLKCHHEVTELEPSERFPDPPAPKLVEGYNLVRRFGCFGCHEINGYDGPDRRIGPDLRSEPNFFAAAHSLLDESALTAEERGWAERLVEHPEDDVIARHRLLEVITADEQLAQMVGDPQTSDQPRFAESGTAYKLGALLKDVENPGKFSRVGPSLRFLSSKVDLPFLYSWIRRPSEFRPTTRMPQFFGQWEHLSGSGLAMAERFEPIEIRAIAHYLLEESKEFEYLPRAEGVTAEPSAQRGKTLFETRGCLACHSHQDFPGIQQDQGPDLSQIGAKLSPQKGEDWLYSWIKQPHRYHVRTKMPDLFLDPIVEVDAVGVPTGEVTDPAADIVAYLLGSGDWQPVDVPDGLATDLSDEQQAALEDLAMEWLATSFPRRRATTYLAEGIPASMAGRLQDDEKTLLGLTPANRNEKLLAYVGVESIQKYGCFGCHDIPGFEDAKPIGTTLADWGRKDQSKLAFELIGSFLGHKGINGDGLTGHGESGESSGGHGLAPDDFDSDTSYYLQAIKGHRREGFIWQKLRFPRSYDYEKTENKGYNERLRMPRFPINDEQREAIITFVLGLVSEPPAAQYVYQPDVRQQAIVEGRKVLDKYNCAGCHTLRMDRWEFDYHPDELGAPPAGTADYPFNAAHFTPEEILASQETDRRGLSRAVVHGMPQMSEEDGQPLLIDIEGTPLEPIDIEEGEEPFYSFTLFRDTVLAGEAYQVGGPKLSIRQAGVKKYPAWGGELTRYLFPRVIAAEKEINPQVKGSEAWSWLPPPLVGEGEKVQPDWLYDFLLDPSRIRPAAVLRMPNFHMSPAEARKLADYFAAVDNVDYPYEFDPRRSASPELAMPQERSDRLTGGLNIVLDRNFCVTCHLVGDFRPAGRVTALAPNLNLAHRRLRPEFVHRWTSNPMRILPYTGMPVNVPYENGVDQQLFPGTSSDQLDAVVDFLMNFDVYTEQQTSIENRIKPPVSAPVSVQPGQ